MFIRTCPILSSSGVERPRVSIPPSHTHAFPGESVMLRCVGDSRTLSYSWYKDGQLLVTSDRVTVVNGSGLNISHVTVDDSGVYSCVVIGTEGSSEASAQLSVTDSLISCKGESLMASATLVCPEPPYPVVYKMPSERRCFVCTIGQSITWFSIRCSQKFQLTLYMPHSAMLRRIAIFLMSHAKANVV